MLSEGRFIEYPAAAEELAGRVARNHIPLQFTGDTATPLFDQILKAQYPDEGDGRPDMLCALMGRVLFDVKKLDNWQVVPLIIGEGGTGKSCILDVVDAFFDPSAVCEIDSNFEAKFGLQDKYEKEVIFIRDAPHNMSAVLNQGTFQKMVSGDGTQVSKKNMDAVHVKWRVPMIAASNAMFDYKDNASQVSRRVVPFWFNKVLSAGDVDGALVDMIKTQELPNVIARCLSEYRKLLDNGGWRKSFWVSGKSRCTKNRGMTSCRSSYLKNLLALKSKRPLAKQTTPMLDSHMRFSNEGSSVMRDLAALTMFAAFGNTALY